MKRTVQVTTEQLGRLVADLRALPGEPVGEHLSDEEFVGYTMEALQPPAIGRLDTHLASCPECATEMERLVEAAQGWDEERLAHLREHAHTTLRDVPPSSPPPNKGHWGNLQAALTKIASLFIGWQVPVASVAGILMGIALTLLMPRLMEQEGTQTSGPTEQTGGETRGGQETGECELTLDRTALPAAEEWLKRIGEEMVKGHVDVASNQSEVFRCYYPDYRRSPSGARQKGPKAR